MNEETIYKVIKKGDGKFYPRIFIEGFLGGNWFRDPYCCNTLEEAVKAIKDKIAEDERLERMRVEEVVYIHKN